MKNLKQKNLENKTKTGYICMSENPHMHLYTYLLINVDIPTHEPS